MRIPALSTFLLATTLFAQPPNADKAMTDADNAFMLSLRTNTAALEPLLAREPVRRRPLLEQRLVRIEDSADEADTRAAAATLRRKL